MQVLSAVVPVIAMLITGMLLRTTGFVSRKGIDDIKMIVSRIMLSVAVFHALSTADYTQSTLLMIAVMLLIDLLTFAAGFLIRPLFPSDRRKYIPFLMSLYEGGMLAYPLYTNLCGSSNLWRIAVIDIAGLLFGFGIWMGMLQQAESGEKTDPKTLLNSALHTPTFIAAVLGVICGATGVIKLLLPTAIGAAYLGCEQMITAPLSAMILLAVGYDLDLHLENIREVFRPICARALIQAAAIACAVFAVLRIFPGQKEMIFAAVIYMIVPTTFSMHTYIKEPDGCRYVSNVNSLYVILTVAAYFVAAVVYHSF